MHGLETIVKLNKKAADKESKSIKNRERIKQAVDRDYIKYVSIPRIKKANKNS